MDGNCHNLDMNIIYSPIQMDGCFQTSLWN